VTPSVEDVAKSMYDHAMMIRDPSEYGWHWMPWDDLTAERRDPYLDAARERLDEEEKLRHLVKVMEQAERDWETTHPPHALLPGAIVPMSYLAQGVLRAGYVREE
jgi:hypothetical protein